MDEYFCIKAKKQCVNCKYFTRLNYCSEVGSCKNRDNFNDPEYYEFIEKFISSSCEYWRYKG